MDIYYEHKHRRIIDQDGNTHTFDQAMAGINDGTFDAWNMALETLMQFDGDMEAVEGHYQLLDNQLEHLN